MARLIFISALFPAYSLLVVSSGVVFYENWVHFSIRGGEFFGIAAVVTLAVALGVTLVVALLARFLPETLILRVAATFMALGASMFLQANYVVWDPGPLDGSGIDWSRSAVQSGLAVLIWIGPFAATQVAASLRRPALIQGISVVLIAIQTVPLALHAISSDANGDHKEYTADRSGLMAYSATRNAILVVVDEYQCDIFGDVLAADPDLARRFEDFLLFPDTVAISPQTFPSVPTMLTGQVYQNRQPTADWIIEAQRGGSLPVLFRDAGVTVELYPAVLGTVVMSPEIASNAIRRRLDPADFWDVVRFGAVRSGPQWLKKLILEPNGPPQSHAEHRAALQTERQRNHPWNMPAFRAALPEATADRQDPVFKFIHLEGVHVPIHLDENLDPILVDYDRESVTSQAMGVARMLADYLDRLKELGIYDRTTIVIAGDHGTGRSEGLWLDPGESSDEVYNRAKARACPLMLAKPSFGSPRPERDALAVSMAPVGHLDIIPTLLSGMGVEYPAGEGGRGEPAGIAAPDSVFNIAPGTHRTRPYMFYQWEGFEKRYLAPITEYLITGDVRDDASWAEGRRFVADP